MTGVGFALLLFCIVIEIARELCFKRAVDLDEAQDAHRSFLQMLMHSPLLWAGIGCWMMEMIAWIQVLQRLPLNVAFPIVSVVYCGVPLASMWLLGEQVTRRHWIGAGIITLGVALVGLAEV